MRCDPPGIAATDFNGSGEPLEKGRTDSWNVPKDVLPAQPSGTAPTAGATANDTAINVRITTNRRAGTDKSRLYTEHPG